MSPELFEGVLEVALGGAAPFLVVAFVVGLVLGVVQAATSVQDQSSAQAVRALALVVTALVAGPWALSLLGRFTLHLWTDLARFLR